MTPEVGDLANAALETLEALNQHTGRCPQCRSGPDVRWCDTYATYVTNWTLSLQRWQEARRRWRETVNDERRLHEVTPR